MIIINLKGGLGNQMFQYALGRKLSINNSDELKLDISGLDHSVKVKDTYRPYALSEFRIAATIASPKESSALRYPYGPFSFFLEKLRRKVLRQYHVGFEPQVLRQTGNMYLNGYWQSPKYFADIREILLGDFTLAAPLSPSASRIYEMIQERNTVSLHVRRGDYVANSKVQKLYGACSSSYYERAIEEISKSAAEPLWFIFSDDTPWVRSNLTLPSSAVFVSAEDMSDAEELWLMSRCTHNVIANSSFSWWGAWLNTNPEKTIIAPTPWFDYDPEFNNDIIPITWKQLPKH